MFNCLLFRYHYLGHRNTSGENIRYLVRDRAGQPVGCALFGSTGGEVRGARRLDRLGSRNTRSEPGVADQQHALTGVALGRGAAPSRQVTPSRNGRSRRCPPGADPLGPGAAVNNRP